MINVEVLMKNIKNVGLSLILFLGINTGFAAVEEMSDVSNHETISNSLSESLRDFKTKNPQFDYGITSIGDLYSKGINIDDFYAPKQSHPYLRKAIFASELVIEGACGYLRAALLDSIGYKNNKLDIKLAGGFFCSLYSQNSFKLF